MSSLACPMDGVHFYRFLTTPLFNACPSSFYYSSCTISLKESKLFYPSALKKKSRYSQIIISAYQYFKGRYPTTNEHDTELARTDQNNRWAFYLIQQLKNDYDNKTVAEKEYIELVKEILAAQEADETDALQAQLDAEAQALALI